MDLLDAGQAIMGPIGFACLLAGWKALDRLACCCLHCQWVATHENADAAAEGMLPCLTAGQLLITSLDVIDAASGL